MANWSKMFEGLGDAGGSYLDGVSASNKEKRDRKLAKEEQAESRTYAAGLLSAQNLREDEKAKQAGITAGLTLEEKRLHEAGVAKTKLEGQKEVARIKKGESGELSVGDRTKLMNQETKVLEQIEEAKAIDGTIPSYLLSSVNEVRALSGKPPLTTENYETYAAKEHWFKADEPAGQGQRLVESQPRTGGGMLGNSPSVRPDLSSFHF